MYIFWVSFRGQKKLGPRPDRSPLGVNSKFPTNIPIPFICGVPPLPRANRFQMLYTYGNLGILGHTHHLWHSRAPQLTVRIF